MRVSKAESRRDRERERGEKKANEGGASKVLLGACFRVFLYFRVEQRPSPMLMRSQCHVAKLAIYGDREHRLAAKNECGRVILKPVGNRQLEAQREAVAERLIGSRCCAVK